MFANLHSELFNSKAIQSCGKNFFNLFSMTFYKYSMVAHQR